MWGWCGGDRKSPTITIQTADLVFPSLFITPESDIFFKCISTVLMKIFNFSDIFLAEIEGSSFTQTIIAFNLSSKIANSYCFTETTAMLLMPMISLRLPTVCSKTESGLRFSVPHSGCKCARYGDNMQLAGIAQNIPDYCVKNNWECTDVCRNR